ncbi:MAG: c-type cytochrome [Alphaproteobacteria bacterium]
MTLLRVAFFSLVVVLAFTLFANILPQVQSDSAQRDEVATAALGVAGQVAWGERIFGGKGTCTLCHNNLGRAPDLLAMDLAAAFAERVADPRYQGEARDLDGASAVESYVRESLLAPSAFVVAGYGKKGTNDTESQMPKADGALIALTGDEINALIAFLQDRAGVAVTVPLPGQEPDLAAVEPGAEPVEEADEDLPADTPEAVIDRLACPACHDLEGSGADIGPNLAGIGSRLGRAEIQRAILDPNAEIADGYEPDLMPPDYGEQIWASELELVIDYLQALPEEPAP